MKKWQIENLEKSEISEKLFLVFLFPGFRFCPTAKIENSDLKISEKNFRDFRDSRGFRVFDLTMKFQVSIFRSIFYIITHNSFFQRKYWKTRLIVRMWNLCNILYIRVWPFQEGRRGVGGGGPCQPSHFYAKQNNSLKRYSISIILLSKGVKDAFFLSSQKG